MSYIRENLGAMVYRATATETIDLSNMNMIIIKTNGISLTLTNAGDGQCISVYCETPSATLKGIFNGVTDLSIVSGDVLSMRYCLTESTWVY